MAGSVKVRDTAWNCSPAPRLLQHLHCTHMFVYGAPEVSFLGFCYTDKAKRHLCASHLFFVEAVVRTVTVDKGASGGDCEF